MKKTWKRMHVRPASPATLKINSGYWSIPEPAEGLNRRMTDLTNGERFERISSR